ncbi:hypothetical protein BCR41DRAFT_244224 [Lobosporangium transversale]|uniref:Uncharacterized protein n=1 Tax=Lobosporangium transversale TaxID=64571 RepID=A0A1Y2GTZ0_9FUNG|nr:hypothetical protein BCR41DRAFT_244224 [Lobosporangium transversale]ORZ23688.1 hypothetical protein BCR41DRAFT_244224 [Lobosporangium transversale]|eukprot:XP_021883502.1 hypothetical protein BCR41DRAFT_244224 [Lobosporangium transversale]
MAQLLQLSLFLFILSEEDNRKKEKGVNSLCSMSENATPKRRHNILPCATELLNKHKKIFVQLPRGVRQVRNKSSVLGMNLNGME